MTFSDRLKQRLWLWWGKPRRWGSPRTYTDGFHRHREWRTFRQRDDLDADWRCCQFWQRTLINKWNGREFAARHGCRLPELYWRGPAVDVPLERLPGEFVIRAVQGHSRRGVHVVANGRDLLWDQSATPEELRERLREPRRLNRGLPVLAEEFVKTPAGEYRLPPEFKCHVFADTVAAVEVLERTGPDAPGYRYYSSRWEPISAVVGIPGQETEATAPPPGLDELLGQAVRLGVAVGTYMRIDFFRSDQGWVFDEFSSTPLDPKYYTPSFQELFTVLWNQKCPRAT